jgi:hypothetical protein
VILLTPVAAAAETALTNQPGPESPAPNPPPGFWRAMAQQSAVEDLNASAAAAARSPLDVMSDITNNGDSELSKTLARIRAESVENSPPWLVRPQAAPALDGAPMPGTAGRPQFPGFAPRR